MKVKELMCPIEALAILPLNTTIETCACAMRARQIGSIIVCDESENHHDDDEDLDVKEIGIVTNYDIIDAFISGLSKDLPILSIMSRNLIRISSNETCEVAATLMNDKRVHHLIVREEHKMVGLLSSFDLSRFMGGGTNGISETIISWLSGLQQPQNIHPQVTQLEKMGYLPRSKRYCKNTDSKNECKNETCNEIKTKKENANEIESLEETYQPRSQRRYPPRQQSFSEKVKDAVEKAIEYPRKTIKKLLPTTSGSGEMGDNFEKVKSGTPFPAEKTQILK